MKRLLKLLLVFGMSLPGGVWSMNKEEEVQIEEPSPSKIVSQKKVQPIHTPTKKAKAQEEQDIKKEKQSTQCIIKFQNSEFNVPQNVIEQFELYKIQKTSGTKFGNKNITIIKHPSAHYAKGTEDIGRPTPPQRIVWDITTAVEQLFGLEINETVVTDQKVREKFKKEKYTEFSNKYGIDLKNIVQLMIDLAAGKKDASSVEDKEVLFLVIKIADFLGNKTILQQCNTILMDKLMGKHRLDNFVRNLIAPRGSEHTSEVSCVTNIPETLFVVSGSDDAKLKIWNYETGQFVRDLTAPQGSEHTGPMSCVTSMQGTLLIVSGSSDGMLKVWNYKTGQFVRDLVAPQGSEQTGYMPCVTSIQETPFIVSGSLDTNPKVWNYVTGQFERNLTAPQGSEHTGYMSCVTSIQGTSFIVSGSGNGKLKVWNYKTGQFVRDLIAPQGSEHTGYVFCVTSIQGTPFIVSGSDETKLKVWNYKTGQFVRDLIAPQGSEHTGYVFCVTSIQGTPFIVSGSSDGMLKVWNYKTGRFVRNLTASQGSEHINWVRCVTSIPGTPFVVSGSADEKLKVWTLNPAADFTFQQIELCWLIFTSEKPVELKEGTDEHETFMSLPKDLQNQILKLKKAVILPQTEKKK